MARLPKITRNKIAELEQSLSNEVAALRAECVSVVLEIKGRAELLRETMSDQRAHLEALLEDAEALGADLVGSLGDLRSTIANDLLNHIEELRERTRSTVERLAEQAEEDWLPRVNDAAASVDEMIQEGGETIVGATSASLGDLNESFSVVQAETLDELKNMAGALGDKLSSSADAVRHSIETLQQLVERLGSGFGQMDRVIGALTSSSQTCIDVAETTMRVFDELI